MEKPPKTTVRDQIVGEIAATNQSIAFWEAQRSYKSDGATVVDFRARRLEALRARLSQLQIALEALDNP
jgi:hypothetical protein